MFFEKIPEKGCKCTIAVRNTFFNLINKNYKTADALKLSFKVLKYHHPEIPDHKIPKRVGIMINPKLKNILWSLFLNPEKTFYKQELEIILI